MADIFSLPEADRFFFRPVEVPFGLGVAEEGAEVRGVGLVGQLDQKSLRELERARKLIVNLPDAVLTKFKQFVCIVKSFKFVWKVMIGHFV